MNLVDLAEKVRSHRQASGPIDPVAIHYDKKRTPGEISEPSAGSIDASVQVQYMMV